MKRQARKERLVFAQHLLGTRQDGRHNADLTPKRRHLVHDPISFCRSRSAFEKAQPQ